MKGITNESDAFHTRDFSTRQLEPSANENHKQQTNSR